MVGTIMAIRFYCVYCNRQLGIASRKAGAVVNCPNCKKKLRVPNPEEEAAVTEAEHRESAGAAPPAGQFFEQGDFDEVLRDDTVHPDGPVAVDPELPATHGEEQAPLLPVQLVPTDPSFELQDRFSNRIWVVLIVIGLIALAFVGGFYLGRATI